MRPELPLAGLQVAIKDGLMAFSCPAGLAVIAEMMQEEVAGVVGRKAGTTPPGWPSATAGAPGSVVLGSRTVPVHRPRTVLTDGGGEVSLDT